MKHAHRRQPAVDQAPHSVPSNTTVRERYANHRFYQVGVVWFCRLGSLAC